MKSIIVLLIILVLYFLPTFNARERGHAKINAIFVLNLFLGWTFLGWLGALLWAMTGEEGNGETRACPFCAEKIKSAAMTCRFYGRSVEPLPSRVKTYPACGTLNRREDYQCVTCQGPI